MKILKQIETRFIYGKDFDRILELAIAENENIDANELYEDWHRGSGMLATDSDGYIVGFCIYKLETNYIEINHLVVDKAFRRTKVGTKLMERIRQKLSDFRNVLITEVPETNLPAQLFLKSAGFTAELVKKATEDILRFKYSKG